MLETVKTQIHNIPSISFHQFFVRYMLQVQDSNIDYEFRKFISVNNLDVKSMERLLNSSMEVLV